jgi:hypothetical protein
VNRNSHLSGSFTDQFSEEKIKGTSREIGFAGYRECKGALFIDNFLGGSFRLVLGTV